MRILFMPLLAFATACHDDKSIETPHPVEGDCVIDRTQAQLDCLKKSTSAEADVCIADVKAKKDCVDGGK